MSEQKDKKGTRTCCPSLSENDGQNLLLIRKVFDRSSSFSKDDHVHATTKNLAHPVAENQLQKPLSARWLSPKTLGMKTCIIEGSNRTQRQKESGFDSLEEKKDKAGRGPVSHRSGVPYSFASLTSDLPLECPDEWITSSE